MHTTARINLGAVLFSSLAILFTILAGRGTEVSAEDWPAFRGPTLDGVAAASQAPRNWSSETAAWTAELPRPGNGSPIIVGQRVLVTSAEDAEGRRRSLYCFDLSSGRQRWVRTVEIDRVMPTHQTNPYAGTTPVSDGQRVVVWHASAGLYCYDLEGQELWSLDLGEFRHMWGYGTSPILYKDRVILSSGPGRRIFMAAIDLERGTIVWKTDEPQPGDGQTNAEGKYFGSWATPILVPQATSHHVVAAMPTRVVAYDADTGRIVWYCRGLGHDGGDLAYSSPLIVDQLCFVTGGFRGPALAIRLGGQGDVTDDLLVYRKENNPQNIGSAVAVDGFVYRPNAGPGTLECLDPKTGEIRWTERVGNCWASIVRVGELLYVTNQEGTTRVMKPNPVRYEQVAQNDLEGTCNATPAVAQGCLVFRTSEGLVCIR